MLHICNDGTKYVEICEAFWAESNTQRFIRHKGCRKLSVFVTLTWICNVVKVRLIGTLHIYIMIVQLIGTKYEQIYKVVWAESSIQSTTRYTKGSVFVSLICNEVNVKMKGVLHF